LRKIVQSLGVLTASLLMLLLVVPATPASAACAPVGDGSNCHFYIAVKEGISIGVIHNKDGSYGAGGTQKYDGLLPAYRNTWNQFGWSDGAAGYYIGPGYCLEIEQYSGGVWNDLGLTGKGPGYYYTFKNSTYRATAYSCI
jgi:hypothetical protein